MLGYFLRHLVAEVKMAGTTNVLAITDSIPHVRKRRAIEKRIKSATSRHQLSGTQYRLLHHASRSHFGLQVADYCLWAIQRKWEISEFDCHRRIRSAIRNESDIFRNGTSNRYSPCRGLFPIDPPPDYSGEGENSRNSCHRGGTFELA